MINLPKDQIGRELLVDKIKYVVDTMPQDEHCCLALDGEWGSGKSYVIGMLQHEFDLCSEYIVINYDAWKNNFYSDPLLAILYCILDSVPKEKISRDKMRLVKSSLKQVIKNKVNSLIDTQVDKLYKVGGWGSVCAFALEIIKLVIKRAKNSILDNKLFDDFKSYQTLLNESIAVLDSLTKEKDSNGNQRRLVILVDEIDRCLPNEQLIVLERLHHLFNVKNCAVIVALNKSAIYANFKTKFGSDGQEYLRKFFTYNFTVISKSDKLLENRIRDFIDDINNYTGERDVYTEEEIKPMLTSIFNEVHLINIGYSKYLSNRDVSQYLDDVLKIWNRNKHLNILYLWFLLLMVFYKFYNENMFKAYLNGYCDNTNLISLKYDIKESDKCSISFVDARASTVFSIYHIDLCNKMNLFLNLVRFRNNGDFTEKLKNLNEQLFGYSDIFNEEDKTNIEKYLNEIDKYGMK